MIRSLLLALSASTLAIGCTVTTAPPPAYQVNAGVAPADDIAYEAPPPNIETYPSYVYAGTPHYYVNGRWYTHTTRGWGYRRTEPRELAQHRPAPRPEERREEHR